MSKTLQEVVADAIQTLLLSDHMGDAHEATLELARALGGEELADKVVAYVEGDLKALVGDQRFGILSKDYGDE